MPAPKLTFVKPIHPDEKTPDSRIGGLTVREWHVGLAETCSPKLDGPLYFR